MVTTLMKVSTEWDTEFSTHYVVLLKIKHCMLHFSKKCTHIHTHTYTHDTEKELIFSDTILCG